MYDNREERRRYSLGRGRADRGSNRAGNGTPSFAIIRAKKLSTAGQIASSAGHTFRERETPNADPNRTAENQILVGPENAKEIIQAWNDRAPDKVRANAVRAVEYLITGSPEAMQKMSRAEQDSYFKNALAFLQDKHGKDNILSAVVHRDETTPHLTAMVIPLDDRGKLNARQFLGGRDKLRQLQTDFAERVGKEHGLERGIENSRARHRTIRSFYAEVEGVERRAVKETPAPPRYLADKGTFGEKKEPIDDYEKRVAAEWKQQLAPLVAKARRADELEDRLTATIQKQVREQPERDNITKKARMMDKMMKDPASLPALQDFLKRQVAERDQGQQRDTGKSGPER
jgi:hypothetical protein